MQIEDGGDSQEVSQLLLAALMAGTLHQVGIERAQPVIQAVKQFADGEAERWRQVKEETLPPSS
jgi:hypothetical protein